jgi:malate synthase
MRSTQLNKPAGVDLLVPADSQTSEILTPEALHFIVDLERRFGPRRRALLALRAERQKRLDAGEHPNFLSDTAEIRNASWTVAPLPADLLDRRVEITGPVDRKMIINALNSGASAFMADFEDSNTPTWTNLIEGQVNLFHAVRRTITFTDLSTDKSYKLNPQLAVLLVRPRGWHLPEKHVVVDGQPISGSLFDFGLYFFHNTEQLLSRGSGPYFYLPKIESHLEARLWNDVFVYAQQSLGVKNGTIKATVLIETILAAFEMDEILYELREHSSGLNCGRWDYIFSFIKKFANDPSAVLPDRSRVTMSTHFMRSYSRLAIKTCHRREVHAMGGMSAYIPNRRDAAANEIAMEQVRADKEREAADGHDGTWVAHPGLVPLVKEIFNRYMPTPNQIERKLEDLRISVADLTEIPKAEITEAGVRQNVAVSIGYLESWLRGIGCVPLFNLMEDAATAEISRAQLWQWIRHQARLDDGRTITLDFCLKAIDDELAHLRSSNSDQYRATRYETAADLLRDLIRSDAFVEFLTLPAYDRLAGADRSSAVSSS